MNAASVMTTSLVSISPDAPISNAIALMLEKRLSGLPVVATSGALVGMISEGDFLRRGEIGTATHRARWIEFFLSDRKLADEYIRSHGRRVSEIMTTDIVWAHPTDSLEHCVNLMLGRGIKRLPVLENGKLVGILTRADLLRAVMSQLPEGGAKPEDSQIRADVLAALCALGWVNRNTLSVAVKNGAVALSGTIFDERNRQALIVAAENVPGVTSVTENLLLIEPYMGTSFPTNAA